MEIVLKSRSILALLACTVAHCTVPAILNSIARRADSLQ